MTTTCEHKLDDEDLVGTVCPHCGWYSGGWLEVPSDFVFPLWLLS